MDLDAAGLRHHAINIFSKEPLKKLTTEEGVISYIDVFNNPIFHAVWKRILRTHPLTALLLFKKCR